MSSKRTLHVSRGRMATCLTLAIALAACSSVSSPGPTETPDQETPSFAAPASGSSPGASGSPGVGAADDCAASIDFQLAYEVPGMDDVEVTCDIVYKEIADTDATLDLYLPPRAAADAALPAVVFVHGNGDIPELKPIEEHWKRDQYTAARVVATLGYAAISFDYRGYDLPDRLADAERDVLDLLAFVETNAADLNVDPDRICLWSVSGGGLPAAWASIYGDPKPICTVLVSAGFAGALSEADPVAAIGAGTSQVFLAHGAQDEYANPDRFVDAATASGWTVTVETHPGRHGWESTPDPEQQRIIGRALAFVEERLGDG